MLTVEQSLESKQECIWLSRSVLKLWIRMRERCSSFADKTQDALLAMAAEKVGVDLETSTYIGGSPKKVTHLTSQPPRAENVEETETSVLSDDHMYAKGQHLSRLEPIRAMFDKTWTPEEPNQNVLEDRQKATYWLKNIDDLNKKLLTSTLQKSSQQSIRIAILDSGYGNDAILSHRIAGWKDWVDGDENLQDCDGHGTHLASLIMRIAPEAEIYVARILKKPSELHLACENIAEAINFSSSTWKADIICMAFGFCKNQPQISKAIRNAVNQRNESILFFAAAGNSHANANEMFPARHENVISIRGTDAGGGLQSYNPPRQPGEGAVLGTLGVEVPAASLSPMGIAYEGGTSVATAIAVGMAAMMLGYVEANSSRSTYQMVRDKLRTREGMLAMLKSLACNSLDDGYWYVAPWRLRTSNDEEVRWAPFVTVASGYFDN